LWDPFGTIINILDRLFWKFVDYTGIANPLGKSEAQFSQYAGIIATFGTKNQPTGPAVMLKKVILREIIYLLSEKIEFFLA
jgi:hypothetical protein